jgi:hypothetical protein
MPAKKALHCFCARKPLLAYYGVDEQGRVYVHIKVYKQARIYGETLHYGGELKIRCRECFRWHRVVFVRTNELKLEEEADPPELAV